MKKWFVLGTALALTACGGNSNKVSKSDLQEALVKSPQAGTVCVPFALNVATVQLEHGAAYLALGSPEIRLLKRLPSGKRANQTAAEQMDILVGAGIYDDAGVTKIGEGEHTMRFLTYRLTEKGRNAFQYTPHGHFLCIGTLNVKKIHYYTEPAPSNGLTLTQVSYDADIKTERWARKLLKDNPYYEGLNQTETRTATLVKTNEGWRDVRDLRVAH